MFKEACSPTHFVSQKLLRDRERFVELGQYLRTNPPTSVVTVARGSSDHAANYATNYATNYAAYLIMARLGHIVLLC